MSGEKYDVRNSDHKEVSDLPEEIQGGFVDVPEEKGGGFVRESAQETELKAGKEAAMERIPASVFRRFFNASEHERAVMDNLLERAKGETPIEAIIESESLALEERLTGEAWDKMREALPDSEDWLTVDYPSMNARGTTDPGWSVVSGSIGGKSITFRRGIPGSLVIDGESVNSDTWVEVAWLSDVAIDKVSIREAVDSAMYERKQFLDDKVSRADKWADMNLSKDELERNKKGREDQKAFETEFAARSAEIVAPIMERVRRAEE